MSGIPKLFEDNKTRTFVSPDNVKEILENKEIPENFDIDEYFRDEDKYLDINLGDADDLVAKIKQNVKKIDNIIDIGDNESINFNDIIDFLKDIIDGKINNSNKEEKYNGEFKDIEKNLENRTKDTNNIKLYIIYLNKFKKYYLHLTNHQAKV